MEHSILIILKSESSVCDRFYEKIEIQGYFDRIRTSIQSYQQYFKVGEFFDEKVNLA